MLRKTVVTLIAVYFRGDPRAQGLMGLLVIVVSVVLHTRYLPYCFQRMTFLEFASLTTTASLYFLGQFTMDAGTYGASFQPVASMSALVLNVAFLVLATGIALKILREHWIRQASALRDDTKANVCSTPDLELEMTVLPDAALRSETVTDTTLI